VLGCGGGGGPGGGDGLFGAAVGVQGSTEGFHEGDAVGEECFRGGGGGVLTGVRAHGVSSLLLGTGELKRNAEASVTEFRAATARLEAFLTELAGYLPGVDLKHVDW